MSKVLVRTFFGVVLIALVGGMLLLDWRLRQVGHGFLNGLALTGLFAVLCCWGYLELRRLAKAVDADALPVAGLLGVATVVSLPYWDYYILRHVDQPGFPLWPLTLLAVLAGLFLEQMLRHRTRGALGNLAASALGVLYLGVGGAAAVWIGVVLGLGPVILMMAAAKATDVGAYFTGTAIGKHKMIPWLSPGKSWEGLVGGLAFAAAASMLAVWLMGMQNLSPASAAVFGVVIGAVGQFSDLCESLLKRAAAAKDSGNLVPEFGGVLDVIDSPLLAAPVAILLFELL